MSIDEIRALVAKLTLREKIEFIGGGIECAALKKADIPETVLTSELLPYSASEPSELAVGCTFSKEIAASLGKEKSITASRTGAAFAGTVSCGLILNPMRISACGFFSEDAFLAAELLKSYSEYSPGYVFTGALGQGLYGDRTVDERALHELYLYPLYRAGKNAAAVMTDGGYLNGRKVSSSREISDMYRGFTDNRAMLITAYNDCDEQGAVNSGAYALKDEFCVKDIIRAAERGDIAESKIDKIAERTLYALARAKEFGVGAFDDEPNRTDIAIDSAVLLKNDGVLPAKDKSVAFFGDGKFFDDGEEYGLMPISSALSNLKELKVFLVTDYGDGLSGVADIISGAADSAPTVLVLCGGAATPIPMEKSLNAVLFCPYCPKVSDIYKMLTEFSPRGRLPFTWCASAEDYPRNNKKYLSRGDFRYESLYNGYALFNNHKSDILYPFGHGLSYTSFEIEKVNVTGGDKITAEFDIKNTGDKNGVAVVQMYVTLSGASVYGLTRRLVAFKRVHLKKGESAGVKLDADLSRTSVYDENNMDFRLVGGKYRVDIGLSSKDIRASKEVKLISKAKVSPRVKKENAPSYYITDGVFLPTAPEIEKILSVPFISKKVERPELNPPPPEKVKPLIARAKKSVPIRLFPRVKHKIENTPIN